MLEQPMSPKLAPTNPFTARMLLEEREKTITIVKIISLLLFSLLAWAMVANVPQSARGQSKVTPSKRLQVIQAVDGGVITNIFVSEGERVSVGDTLVTIDTTRSASNLQEKLILEASLRLREIRLQAELTGSELVVPKELSQQFPELVRQETSLLSSRLSEVNALTQVYLQQVRQREGEKAEASSRATAALTTVELLGKELAQTRPLVSTGAISPLEVLRLEKQLAQAKGDLYAAQAQSQKSDAAIAEAKNKLQEVRLKVESQAKSELSEVKAKLAGLAQTKIELTDRVNQATLKAPIGGLVKRILYSTQGAVVPAGQPILEIVPDDEILVFETQILPRDIGFIRPEQQADIRLSAYDFTTYGSIRGFVADIAPDSILDEFGNTYYLVKVQVGMNDIPEAIKLIPGMQAEVNIRIDDRSVLAYLLKPLLRGLDSAFSER